MQAPERIVGRYALFAEVAAGGMATVHIGRLLGAAGFSRTVAVKRLHAQYSKDPEFVQMFLDEACLVARIHHPNVVPTLDVAAEQGELFLVMEYIQGESLRNLTAAAARAGELTPHSIVRAILAGVLHGLHAAHETKNERGEPLSIVHRDVSPQNVLVGTDGVARVLDFGVAKATDRSHVTQNGQVKGKLAYMSPEQLQGLSVDRRTDVYAAAVVLWEVLTGCRLFAADSDVKTVRRLLEHVVPSPRTLVPSIEPQLEQLVMRALARDPDARYQTARDMAMALEATGPLATSSEVAAWVDRHAHQTLSQRALHVAAMERESSLTHGLPKDTAVPRPEAAPRSSVSAERRWLRGALGAAVAVLLSAVAVVVVAWLGFGVWNGRTALDTESRTPKVESAMPEPWASSAAPIVAAEGVASEGVASEGVAAEGVAAEGREQRPATPSGSASQGEAAEGGGSERAAEGGDGTPETGPSATPRRATQPPAAARPRSQCSPPYWVDGKGHRHYKMECL